MAGRTIMVLDPTAIPRPVQHRLSERSPELRGKTVVLVSNGKPNVGAFYDALEPALLDLVDGLRIERETKQSASIPLARDRLESIAAGHSLAVVAICD